MNFKTLVERLLSTNKIKGIDYERQTVTFNEPVIITSCYVEKKYIENITIFAESIKTLSNKEDVLKCDDKFLYIKKVTENTVSYSIKIDGIKISISS